MKPSHNLCYQWFDDVMIFVSGARSSKVLFIMCISTDCFEINRSIRRWTDSKLGHIASYTFVDITLVCHQYLLHLIILVELFTPKRCSGLDFIIK